MCEVLIVKINTNPYLKSYLYESGDKQLVEVFANDQYLGSGLSFNITVTTTLDKYFGENMFGILLCDIWSEFPLVIFWILQIKDLTFVIIIVNPSANHSSKLIFYEVCVCCQPWTVFWTVLCTSRRIVIH